MNKIKLIPDSNLQHLEDSVNQWLNENPKAKLLDFTLHYMPLSDQPEKGYVGVVLYEQSKDCGGGNGQFLPVAC